MPWDGVYLARWFAFLKQVGDRYGMSPAFRTIAAAGPNSVSEKMRLQQSPQDLKRWQNISYTPRQYIGAWREVFEVFAADFRVSAFLCRWDLVLILMIRAKSILVRGCAPGKRLSIRPRVSRDAALSFKAAISTRPWISTPPPLS
jgi:hypothetical protein